MPRIKHTLWRVSNGWILVPEGSDDFLKRDHAPQCVVFGSLKEFASEYPKRERKKKIKPEPE